MAVRDLMSKPMFALALAATLAGVESATRKPTSADLAVQEPGRAADLILEIPILKSPRLILRAIRADDHSHLVSLCTEDLTS
jgi:hypothetical protein